MVSNRKLSIKLILKKIVLRINEFGGVGVEVGSEIGDEKRGWDPRPPSSEAACVSLFFT